MENECETCWYYDYDEIMTKNTTSIIVNWI